LIHPILKRTSYELCKGKKVKISYLQLVGSKCFVYNNDKNNLEKFNTRSDEGIFMGLLYAWSI